MVKVMYLLDKTNGGNEKILSLEEDKKYFNSYVDAVSHVENDIDMDLIVERTETTFWTDWTISEGPFAYERLRIEILED